MRKRVLVLVIGLVFLNQNCTINDVFIKSTVKTDISELTGSYIFIPEGIDFDYLQITQNIRLFGFISKTPDLIDLNCIGYLPSWQKLKCTKVAADTTLYLNQSFFAFRNHLFLYSSVDGKRYFRAKLDSIVGLYSVYDTIKLKKRDTIAYNYIKKTDLKTFNQNHFYSVRFQKLNIKDQ
jgi:hypothetical protein